jgi:RNA polymerase sigma factor (sigma-70 family)
MTTDRQVDDPSPASQSAPAPTDFEEFVREISGDLLGYFARRVHPPDGAGDCVGEVLLTLWRRRTDLPRPLDERRAWAFGIANKVLSNHIRSSTRRSALTERLREQLQTRPITRIDDFVSEPLMGALRKLRLADRELILLVAWEGFTLAEAASIIGIRADAARTRYSRLRAKLRAALDDDSRNSLRG